MRKALMQGSTDEETRGVFVEPSFRILIVTKLYNHVYVSMPDYKMINTSTGDSTGAAFPSIPKNLDKNIMSKSFAHNDRTLQAY